MQLRTNTLPGVDRGRGAFPSGMSPYHKRRIRCPAIHTRTFDPAVFHVVSSMEKSAFGFWRCRCACSSPSPVRPVTQSEPRPYGNANPGTQQVPA
jgi:hypothetical protein